jgi:hypothetical protein
MDEGFKVECRKTRSQTEVWIRGLYVFQSAVLHNSSCVYNKNTGNGLSLSAAGLLWSFIGEGTEYEIIGKR